jgi:hypothetical protein
MTGFKAFRYYLALKLHFNNDKFNVFQNKGNIKYSYETFNIRNDRYIFDKLARKFDTDQELIQFLVANFAYGHDNMIFAIEEANEYYLEWQKRKQSITRIFKDDLNTIELESQKNALSLDQIINFTLNEYPCIIRLYLGKKISIESVSILNDSLGFIPKWKQNKSAMLILESDIRKIEKVKGFVKYDAEKIKPIFNEFITIF